jgi:hypothetical protein
MMWCLIKHRNTLPLPFYLLELRCVPHLACVVFDAIRSKLVSNKVGIAFLNRLYFWITAPGHKQEQQRNLPVAGKKNPWPESSSELYRPRERHLSAKLMTTFAGRGCHVVSVMDP